MPDSVFTRPRARSPLSSVSSQQVFREVRTEDELRSAVFAEYTNYAGSLYGIVGRRIVVSAPISVRSPIIVTATGVTIESHGKIPIFPLSNAMDCIFDATSSTNLVLRNLLIANNLGVQNPVFGIKLGNFSSMDSCTIVGVDTCVQASFGSSIRGCLLSSYGVATQRSIYVPNGASQIMISGNLLVGDVFADAGSSNCAISANSLLGRNIDTSLSSGSNSIVGNVNVGTITNAATDAVTSNT